MRIVQISISNDKNEVLTTWVDKRPGLKEGAHVTLQDFQPETTWTVGMVWPGEHNAADFDFHRKWDNNNYDKHKGLEWQT